MTSFSEPVELLDKLRLPSSVYDDYLQAATAFLEHVAQVVPVHVPFEKPRLLRSKLFGQQYLVANYSRYAPAAYLEPNQGTAMLKLEVAGQSSPPIVLTSKRLGSSAAYRSVLEHEFVHINQMLLGRLPVLENRLGGPLDFLVARTEMEFEANYLQLTHCDELYDAAECGMSLEEWCCFRSYTGSLEDTIACIVSGQCDLDVSEDFLRCARERVAEALSKIGFPYEISESYVEPFPAHVGVALTIIHEQGRVDLADDALDMVVSWGQANQAMA